jgi:hypothetical protein
MLNDMTAGLFRIGNEAVDSRNATSRVEYRLPAFDRLKNR